MTKNKYTIHTNFLKDISFEIPSAEVYYLITKDIPKYNLSFDIFSKQVKENYIEVNTVLKLVAPETMTKKIHVEINMCSLVSLSKDLKDQDEIKKIILVDVPTSTYPYLYEVFKLLFLKSGIKDMNINQEISFAKLFEEKNKKL